MAQPAKKAKTAASNGTAGILLTFGESMIRFAPLDESPPATATRAEPQPFLRSVGGDELNVAVALSKLGERTRWISVVPQGPMGDVIVESGTANGVAVVGPRPATGDVGTFTTASAPPRDHNLVDRRRRGASLTPTDDDNEPTTTTSSTGESTTLRHVGLAKDAARLAHRGGGGLPTEKT